MIEMDDTLTYSLYGKEALAKKVEVVITSMRNAIPYYLMGLDTQLFTYSSPKEAIQQALSKYNPEVSIRDDGTSHVVIADVDIDITPYLDERMKL